MNKERKPGDTTRFDHEAFPGVVFTFTTPSEEEYREVLGDEKLVKLDSYGEEHLNSSVIDTLLEDHCVPVPNILAMTPGQRRALETAFYNFISGKYMKSKEIEVDEEAKWEKVKYYRVKDIKTVKCPNCGETMRITDFSTEIIDRYGYEAEYTINTLCPSCLKAYKKSWIVEKSGL